MDTKSLERVLLRCVILGVVVVVIWFAFFLVADGLIYSVHGRFFGEITKSQFQIIHYCGMGLTKVFVTVFFFASLRGHSMGGQEPHFAGLANRTHTHKQLSLGAITH